MYRSSAELGIMQKQSKQILHAECIRPLFMTPTIREMSGPAINVLDAEFAPVTAVPNVRPDDPKLP
jgi:hypothetical protein